MDTQSATPGTPLDALARELKKSEDRLRLAIQGGDTVLMLQDENLAYIWVYNPNFAVPSSLIGKTDRDMDIDPEIAAEAMEIKLRVLRTHMEEVMEGWMRTHYSLEKRYMHALIKPYEYEPGKWGIINRVTDLTLHKKLEMELQQTVYALTSTNEQLMAINAEQMSELEDARTMQLAMLPDLNEHLPANFDMAAHMETSLAVGGDYYDFLSGRTNQDADSNTCWLALGDATCHGVKAAIVVAAIKSTLHALCEPKYTPSEMLEILSERLAGLGLRRLYMGLHLAQIECTPDPDGRYRATIASAGMPPYFIVRSQMNTVETLNTRSMFLGTGIKLPQPYKEYHHELMPGDMLVLISDGYSESRSVSGELMGVQDFADIIQRHYADGPQAILDAINRACKAHHKRNVPEDDSTIVVLKCK